MLRALALVLLLISPGAVLADAGAAGSGCVIEQGKIGDHGLAEFVAECRWRVEPRFVRKLLRDAAQIAKSNDTIVECQPLGDERFVYVYEPGWPLARRQVTIERRFVETNDELRAEYWMAAPQEPLREGHVEVEADEGAWVVRALAEGGSHVRYSVRYDPGGNIDPWFVRRFLPPNLESSLERMRGFAEGFAREDLAQAESEASASESERQTPAVSAGAASWTGDAGPEGDAGGS